MAIEEIESLARKEKFDIGLNIYLFNLLCGYFQDEIGIRHGGIDLSVCH